PRPTHSCPTRRSSDRSAKTPPMLSAPAGLHYAEATLADLDALVELEQRCFTGDRLSRRSFRRWLTTPQDILLLAWKEQLLAGYRSEEHTSELQSREKL